MTNGSAVKEFEARFSEFVGAKYAIALCNGTATLHTALVALGVRPGDKVAVPPLTMSATTIAVLQAGAVPVFVDVDPLTWLMDVNIERGYSGDWREIDALLPVSLYGLHAPDYSWQGQIDDAAQTLRPHDPQKAFTSYSFQASKILALGEGGMLVTNSEEMATAARSFSSLGYRLNPKSPRIDPSVIKNPNYERHHLPVSFNYRMNDYTAKKGLKKLKNVSWLIESRKIAAERYLEAVEGCTWIRPQYRPKDTGHDHWTFAVALKDQSLWKPFVEACVRHGSEHPYGAWQLTYREPAFRHLAPDVPCPVAEDLQPRLVQGQTNNLESAEKNARAWRKAIEGIGGKI